MIPAPQYTGDTGSYCWDLGIKTKLWWYDHTRDWAIAITAASGDDSASITLRIGKEAPAALLLLAHNYQKTHPRPERS